MTASVYRGSTIGAPIIGRGRTLSMVRAGSRLATTNPAASVTPPELIDVATRPRPVRRLRDIWSTASSSATWFAKS